MFKFGNTLRYLFILVFITHLLLLLQNYTFISEGYVMGMDTRDLYSTMWDIQYTFTLATGVIFVLTCLLASLNLLLLYNYFSARSTVDMNLHKSNSLSKSNSLIGAVGGILAFLSLSCASCGAVLLSFILSLIGLSINQLPYGGIEFGILGLTILSYGTYSVYKKTRNPYIC